MKCVYLSPQRKDYSPKKRAAKRLPYNCSAFYDRRGGVSPPEKEGIFAK